MPRARMFAALLVAAAASAQPPDFPPPGFPPPPGGFPKGGFPKGGFAPGGFPGFEERKILKDFDKDKDKRLNAAERAAAREFLAKNPGPRRRRFPMGAEDAEPPAPGPKLQPSQVKRYGNEPLYDPKVLRTLFLEFENADWEKELADFHNTDVEVPAKVTVDGATLQGVGIHFRGASSYMMVPEGRKRSLNLSIDFTDPKQRLLGYRTLNLLNSHLDPTYLRSVLYLQIARQYVPAPKANYVRVAINGESWGVYVNAQQFNSDFIAEWFPKDQGGARWKVPGRPFSRGTGLSYLGEDLAAYKRNYEIKSKNDPKSWAALMQFTKVLNQTPPEQLEAAIEPLLDIDGALKFLALEKVFINNDGYWTRASDYSIYLDPKGRFHIIPHDANETFSPVESFGRRGFGPPEPSREHDVKLDPMAGSEDPEKALLHRLLAAPALKQRYLGYVREIATAWLDWKKIEPLARQYQALIAADVKTDTHKLDSTETFSKAVTEETTSERRGPFGGRHMSLKDFVEQRRAYLLAEKR